MTYEQAVATALLKALPTLRQTWNRAYPVATDLATRTYAMRRLRVRAGGRP